ncbi:unnamed protein product [Protopolystoma xenopodis]|uniref:Methyltransferase small domain-containing protein n=1 Tax=Protopolystoma xenopodis TaxID=117903 RepID=A0A448WHH1_9PLAT|nr:unnamed protein product [Protopolystoma xenopodis]
MLTTPDTRVLLSHDHPTLYPPSADSFLFLDALESELDFIRKNVNPSVTIEFGCGSGIISTFLALHLGRLNYYFCTDISPQSCLACNDVFSHNIGTPIRNCIQDSICCNLADPLLTRLGGSVDLILFNPPYVSTPIDEFEQARHNYSTAWAGGPKGRKVIDAFLPQAAALISPSGCIYLLLSELENDPLDVHASFKDISSGRLSDVKLVTKRRALNEVLSVYRYCNAYTLKST